MKKTLVAALTLALFGLGLTSANAAEYKKLTINIATANPPGSMHVTYIEKFREIVEKESNGAIKFKTFYGGSMGDEQANVKQCRDGELQMAVLATGNLTPFAPSAGLVYLPYIFPNFESAHKLYSNKDFMKKINDQVAKESRTRTMAWLIGGYRMITNSKRPINTIEDLKGMKLRVPPVELQLEAYRAWGIEPTPLSWVETFNALQQKVVDGQDNAPSVCRDQKFWEVQKYISNVHYLLFSAVCIVCDPWFQKLDPQTRELLQRASDMAQEYEWGWSTAEEERALKTLLDNGMKFNDLQDEEKWVEKARSVWPRFYDKVGGKAMVDEALAIMSK
ncbi:MAG: TRAP transporter substrate-binding protein [Mailhella sp.]|nr:TRAP transporter substrate-binding protein [Mailhella sp.]